MIIDIVARTMPATRVLPARWVIWFMPTYEGRQHDSYPSIVMRAE